MPMLLWIQQRSNSINLSVHSVEQASTNYRRSGLGMTNTCRLVPFCTEPWGPRMFWQLVWCWEKLIISEQILRECVQYGQAGCTSETKSRPWRWSKNINFNANIERQWLSTNDDRKTWNPDMILFSDDDIRLLKSVICTGGKALRLQVIPFLKMNKIGNWTQ